MAFSSYGIYRHKYNGDFTLTYFAQFIWMLLFIIAPIKYVKENENSDLSLVHCGIIISFICTLSIKVVLYLCKEIYLQMFTRASSKRRICKFR